MTPVINSKTKPPAMVPVNIANNFLLDFFCGISDEFAKINELTESLTTLGGFDAEVIELDRLIVELDGSGPELDGLMVELDRFGSELDGLMVEFDGSGPGIDKSDW